MTKASPFATPLKENVDLSLRLNRMWDSAVAANNQNILALISINPGRRLLDLGCDDGSWTLELGKRALSDDLSGIELVAERATLARRRGVDAIIADLAEALPFPDASFDLVHANQVIEHVSDIDCLLIETMRVLKPGGHAIYSTENGSSWINIGAAILGWQIFSLTNVSSIKLGIGNPLALHREETGYSSTLTHKTIFNYRGLIEVFTAHGFNFCDIKGAGYFPLPAFLGGIDARHAHFLSIKLQKPLDR